jgi:hypothetical protein
VDIAAHKLRINTTWDDYYRFRFYDGKKTWAEKSLYIGERGSRYWPQEGNSLKFERIFALRTIQKSIMLAAGLPTPEIVLKAGRNCRVNSLSKFASEMSKIKFPVLTKSDGGAQGMGIYALHPDKEGFLCDGNVVDANWIWEKYRNNIERGFIVEARVDNHPSLAELHPGSLNTLRLNTIKTADGNWHMVGPFLKIGRHDSHVDNISAGGLLVSLNINGVASTAYCIKTRSSYARHPETDCQIEGFEVPFYQEAVDLALEASRLFGYVATIGWDIGITPQGPTIIEGNLAWGIKGIQEQCGPILSPEIAAGLPPRSWWTPRDKTHMYPYYFNHYAGGWWQRLLAQRRRRWHERLRLRLRENDDAWRD